MDFPFPVSSEDPKSLEAILETLNKLQEADRGPFPYDDIRHIFKNVTSRKKLTRRVIRKGFIPDLAMYFADISGCCGWSPKVHKQWREKQQWPEKRQMMVNCVSEGFFERYPVYLPVRRWITEANTPNLYRDFVLHDEMRVNLLALIQLLNELEGR